MPLIVDGVTIDEVNIDGVEMDILNIDGVEVYSATKVDLSGIPFQIVGFSSGGTATAQYQIQFDGQHNSDVNNQSPVILSPNWLVKGIASDYHVKAVLNSGSSPSGDSTGTWLAMSSTRNWNHSRSGNGTTECNLTIQLSDDGGSTILDSNTFNLEATREP